MKLLEVGHQPGPQKLKYKRVDDRISTLKSRLRNGLIELIQYVDTVAYVLRLES